MTAPQTQPQPKEHDRCACGAEFWRGQWWARMSHGCGHDHRPMRYSNDERGEARVPRPGNAMTSPESIPAALRASDEEWARDVRQVLLSLEGVLRWPIRHPDEGSFEDAAKTAYGGICTLLGIDPRPLLPDWPGTPELAPPAPRPPAAGETKP